MGREYDEFFGDNITAFLETITENKDDNCIYMSAVDSGAPYLIAPSYISSGGTMGAMYSTKIETDFEKTMSLIKDTCEANNLEIYTGFAYKAKNFSVRVHGTVYNSEFEDDTREFMLKVSGDQISETAYYDVLDSVVGELLITAVKQDNDVYVLWGKPDEYMETYLTLAAEYYGVGLEKGFSPSMVRLLEDIL